MDGTSDANTVYMLTIDDVIENVRSAFLEEGHDEDVLQQLRALWTRKLQNSKRSGAQVPTEEGGPATTAPADLPQNVTADEESSPPPPPPVAEKNPMESDSDDESPDDEDGKDGEGDKNEEAIGDEESLNSADDCTDEDGDAFNTENLVLCQYSGVVRNKNRWRFNFSHGIMCLEGREYVFSTANGDAEW